ncbi:hypothetical protein DITRI_Ditri06bG0166500 [Diplodiscus trichospermus]
MISCLKGKRHDEDEDNNQNFFTKNGGVLLEELVTFSNGKPNPIRHFSAKELLIATNYYDTSQIVVQDDGYQLYEGSLKDFPIFVKKYDNYCPLGFYSATDPYKDIAIGSQMSAHKNVLKVIGCCLETKIPAIVYEYAAGTKTLSTCISPANVEPLPWKCRLKIAVDLTNAIAYLHTAFHRPIIHRNIKCSNIILDENNVPKLIHFGQCISIPEGQSHVFSTFARRMRWSLTNYFTYFAEGNITEKIDVYYFGMILFELFTGNKPIHEFMEYDVLASDEHWIRNVHNVVDSRITREGIEAQRLLDFLKLCSRCMCYDEEKRPTMIEMAKELRRIHQSF